MLVLRALRGGLASMGSQLQDLLNQILDLLCMSRPLNLPCIDFNWLILFLIAISYCILEFWLWLAEILYAHMTKLGLSQVQFLLGLGYL